MLPLWSYLVAIPIFGLLILVHEGGHYLAARSAGLAVAEFAVGFGPRIAGFEAGGTQWTLRAIPLGGYVRWHEEGPEAFGSASLAARFWALVAGPLANLLFTCVTLVLLFAFVLGLGWEAVPLTFKMIGTLAGEWSGAILSAITGGGFDLSGPVGMAQMTAEQAVIGFDQLMLFTGFLSLNLCLFNLLPFPALDGGRILVLGLEKVRRRALDPYVEGWIHAGGFLLMSVLALVMTVKDLLA
jgi:membrane-associated protease RseP (regulator of RpoE activity)